MKSFKEFLESKDEAKVIRTRLKKELGLSSKDVSVRTSQGGLSSSVTISIKTLNALKKMGEIKAIGKSNEKYDVDQASGEILMGGNTFIFTEIDFKLETELKEMINAEIEKEAKGTFNEGDLILIYKTFNIKRNQGDDYWVSKKGSGKVVRTNSYLGLTGAIMQLIHKLEDYSLYSKIK